jgi:hypothetical protein
MIIRTRRGDGTKSSVNFPQVRRLKLWRKQIIHAYVGYQVHVPSAHQREEIGAFAACQNIVPVEAKDNALWIFAGHYLYGCPELTFSIG